jgi:hypothetical protein
MVGPMGIEPTTTGSLEAIATRVYEHPASMSPALYRLSYGPLVVHSIYLALGIINLSLSRT